MTVDGNHASRILDVVGGGTDVQLQHLNLANAALAPEQDGGAIRVNGGGLTVEDCTIRDTGGDFTNARGGGIFATSGSRVAVNGSTISGNIGWYGGAIATAAKVSLTVRHSRLMGNRGYLGGGGIRLTGGSTLILEDSVLSGGVTNSHSGGGGLDIAESAATIRRTTISENSSSLGGGIFASNSQVVIENSSLVGNRAGPHSYEGRAIKAIDGSLSIVNSTITGNRAILDAGAISTDGPLQVSNSIIAGNFSTRGTFANYQPDDILGAITLSNGHNVFGSTVAGSIAGDRQNVAAATVFATLDPATGGGQLSPTGIVPLKNALTNPALSAADPITAGSFGQLGTTPRPLPAGSLPDIGSIEIAQPLSTSPTANNDVLTGSNAANNLSGLAGNDLIKGLAGNDTLNGSDGSDVLDGGPGNDVLNGGNGVDIATFAGGTAVVVDLAATPATAKRGAETDTLTSIEGIIGSDGADTFKGSSGDNEFQGGLGKDTATGGAGRDLYAFRSVQDSPPGTNRDIIKDFAPGQDVIDVSNIDADSTLPGQQSFRWVGKATLTGAAQLGYYVAGGNTIVRASTDADAAAEVEIQLNGVKTLTPADFRF